jgi:hypothetical protein
VVPLAAWTFIVAVRIELLNAEAGYYLPGRHGDTIGKWRISADDSPRDRLRGLVSRYGIWQYPLTVVLVFSSFFICVSSASMVKRWTAVCTGLIGLAALGLAIYREYFPSLGW